MTHTRTYACKAMLLLLLPLMAPAQKYTARRTVVPDTAQLAVLNAVIENVKQNSCYKTQSIVNVPDADAQTLYKRSLEALSDWAGPEGNAQTHIDYSDKESATVIYKGICPLGFEPYLLAGWYFYADFTLKIRCKDGRAQTTFTVSNIFTETAGQVHRKDTYPITDVVSRFDSANKGRQKRIAKALIKTHQVAAALTAAMQVRLSAPVDDDF